jgi:hypothetical protein
VARNAISAEVRRLESLGEPFESVAPLVKGARGREGLESGVLDHGVFTAGMVQGLIHDVPSVAELIDRIIGEAMDIVSRRLSGFRYG